jgi:hypothetical protein
VGISKGDDEMSKTDIASAVAAMQAKRAPRPDIWQNPNGTWSHTHDSKREWPERVGAETDLRFTREHLVGKI